MIGTFDNGSSTTTIKQRQFNYNETSTTKTHLCSLAALVDVGRPLPVPVRVRSGLIRQSFRNERKDRLGGQRVQARVVVPDDPSARQTRGRLFGPEKELANKNA